MAETNYQMLEEVYHFALGRNLTSFNKNSLVDFSGKNIYNEDVWYRFFENT